MTNRTKLAKMSTNKLAHFMVGWVSCDNCPADCEFGDNCADRLDGWLREGYDEDALRRSIGRRAEKYGKFNKFIDKIVEKVVGKPLDWLR